MRRANVGLPCHPPSMREEFDYPEVSRMFSGEDFLNCCLVLDSRVIFTKGPSTRR
jgi:hypothetical protein